MLKLNKILFPTDFSRCSEQALTHALFLAKKYKAELHLLHVIFPFDNYVFEEQVYLPRLDIVTPLIDETIDSCLSDVIKSHDFRGVSTKKVVTRSIRPSSTILDYADENAMDLIVIGTQGLRGHAHSYPGSVASELVRFAKCSVLTIKALKEPKPVARSRILVPIDFSEYARNALALAKEIAGIYGAELQLLHVVEEAIAPSFYTTSKSSIFELMPGVREKSGQALERFYSETQGPKVKANFYVVAGNATKKIIQFSERCKSDLIVIATHQLRAAEHFLVGSVGEEVGCEATCPVLTFKPHDNLPFAHNDFKSAHTKAGTKMEEII